MQIIPAIFTDNPQELKENINLLEDKVPRIQIDIVDGQFAAARTIDPIALSHIETNLKIDYHLMVVEPINWLEQCVRGQADRVIGHIEKMESQFEFIAKAVELGVGVGLALDIDTPLTYLSEEMLPDLDVLLVLTVKAGKSGQRLEETIFDKLKQISELRNDAKYDFILAVDGGVNENNILRLRDVGVAEFGMTSSLFNGDFNLNLEMYNRLIQNGR